jgi:hypothetical protein
MAGITLDEILRDGLVVNLSCCCQSPIGFKRRLCCKSIEELSYLCPGYALGRDVTDDRIQFVVDDSFILFPGLLFEFGITIQV